MQRKEEPIASFALRLKQGAAYCEYDTFLDRMLIEQMLHGLYDRSMCDVIIAKKPNTFAESYAAADALESTHKTAEEVKLQSLPAETTHTLLSSTQQYKQNKFSAKVKSKTSGQKKSTPPPNTAKNNYSQQNFRQDNHKALYCYGCGNAHLRTQCPFLNSECHYCKKKGHIAKVC